MTYFRPPLAADRQIEKLKRARSAIVINNPRLHHTGMARRSKEFLIAFSRMLGSPSIKFRSVPGVQHLSCSSVGTAI
jgi:hypothetical protein